MNSVRRLASVGVGLAAALPAVIELAPPTVAAPPEPAAREVPELASLRAAFLAGAPDDLARAGDRLGARRLALALGGQDRELALAAAGAAPAAQDAIWLLEPLGGLARSADRPLAAAGARAAARIAAAFDVDALLTGDVPPDWVRARVADYRSMAADAGRWADVRVASLEVAASLSRALGERARPADVAYDLAAVLADPEPEVRRAAVELTAGPLEPEEIRLLGARAGDDDAAVSTAAVVALCEGLELGEEAAPVLAALGKSGLGRARALVRDGDEPARSAAALCLGADDSESSRAALRQMPADPANDAEKSRDRK
jgi:hypothetical protein